MSNEKDMSPVLTENKFTEFYNNHIYPYLNGAAHTGFTPVGSLLFYDGATAPDNYLVCDGTIYNIADYPELANHYESEYGSKNAFGGDGVTTFAVRDLQGEFLRAAGTNSHANQGSGGDVGEHQDGTNHIYILGDASSMYIRVPTDGQTNLDYDVQTAVTGYRGGNFNGNYSTTDYTSYTARPTNTSFLLCVAYKNIYIDAVIGGENTVITNPQEGQGLVYDATNGVWKNGAGGLHEYSTTEKVIGKWIDGKPVYERVVDFGVLSNGDTSYAYDASNWNIELIIKASGLIKRVSGELMTIPNGYAGNIPVTVSGNSGTGKMIGIGWFDYLPSTGNIQIFVTGFNNNDITNCYVIYEYTKTTDTV